MSVPSYKGVSSPAEEGLINNLGESLFSEFITVLAVVVPKTFEF
jgi:hypothetical protein